MSGTGPNAPVATGQAETPAISVPWPAKDVSEHLPESGSPQGLTILCQIIYTSLIGLPVLMAFVEWILWFLGFIACLFTVLKKAHNWSTRIMAILMMLIFTLLRFVHLNRDRKSTRLNSSHS